MSPDSVSFDDLRELQLIALRLQGDELVQVRMLGVRVDALVQSLLNSVVVDESLLNQDDGPLESHTF